MGFQTFVAEFPVFEAAAKLLPVGMIPTIRSAVALKPVQQSADAGSRDRDTGVGGAVVEVHRVAIRRDGVAARENNVCHVPLTFVHFRRPENPCVTSQQAPLWRVEVKQGQTEAVQAARCRLAHAVVNDQPSPIGFNGRR